MNKKTLFEDQKGLTIMHDCTTKIMQILDNTINENKDYFKTLNTSPLEVVTTTLIRCSYFSLNATIADLDKKDIEAWILEFSRLLLSYYMHDHGMDIPEGIMMATVNTKED